MEYKIKNTILGPVKSKRTLFYFDLSLFDDAILIRRCPFMCVFNFYEIDFLRTKPMPSKELIRHIIISQELHDRLIKELEMILHKEYPQALDKVIIERKKDKIRKEEKFLPKRETIKVGSLIKQTDIGKPETEWESINLLRRKKSI